MNRTGLYALIAILVVAVAALGLYLYREEHKPGIEIKADQNGISLEKN
jgi:hypothetical protein